MVNKMKKLNLELMEKMVNYNNEIFSEISSTTNIQINILLLNNDMHYNSNNYLSEYVLVEGDEIILDEKNRLYLIPIYEHTFLQINRVTNKKQESLIITKRMMEIPKSIIDKLMEDK